MSRARALLLAAIGAAVYANALSGPFIFDDRVAIVQNPHIRSLWSLSEAFNAEPSTPISARPVVNRTLALNFALGGLDVRGYHVVNVALHLLCALALLGATRRTLEGPVLRGRFGRDAGAIAFVCALLWMVHPLQTEAVNYVTQRTEVMMGLFFVSTLYAAIRAFDSRWRGIWTGVAVASSALGMGCKEVMVVAPPLVLLHDAATLSGSMSRALRGRPVLYAGLFASWGVLAWLVTSSAHYEGHNMGFGVDVTPLAYFVSQWNVVLDYLWHSVWPHPLVLDYGRYRPVPLGEAAAAGVVLTALGLATLAAWRRNPPLGFLGLWFFAALAPSSSFVPIESEVGAERRMYVPIMAVIVFGVTGAYTLLRLSPEGEAGNGRRKRRRRVAAGLAAGAAAALAVATFLRNREYQDATVLMRAAVRATPDNPRAHFMLGNRLSDGGDYRRAIRRFRESLRLAPDQPHAHANLGAALARSGELEEALHHYRESLRLEPGDPGVHYNLGVVLVEARRPAEALEHFEAAMRLEPGWRAPMLEAVWILAGAPDPELRDARRAVQLAEQSLALGRAGADARGLEALAAAYAAAGRFTEAAAAARRALERARVDDSGRVPRIQERLRRYERHEPDLAREGERGR